MLLLNFFTIADFIIDFTEFFSWFLCFWCFFKFSYFKGHVPRTAKKLAKLMVTTMESFSSHHSQKSTLCATCSSNYIKTKSVSLMRIDGALQHLRSMSASIQYIYILLYTTWKHRTYKTMRWQQNWNGSINLSSIYNQPNILHSLN